MGSVARTSPGEQTFKMNPPVLATRIGPDRRFEDVIAERWGTPATAEAATLSEDPGRLVTWRCMRVRSPALTIGERLVRADDGQRRPPTKDQP